MCNFCSLYMLMYINYEEKRAYGCSVFIDDVGILFWWCLR